MPPVALDETDALGTLITIAFEVALPPLPSTTPLPPFPPVPVAVAEPVPVLSAVLVAAFALALPPAPPFPPLGPPFPPFPPVAIAVLLKSAGAFAVADASPPGAPSALPTPFAPSKIPGGVGTIIVSASA